MKKDKYTSESGRHADPQRIIDHIDDTLEDVGGYHFHGDEYRKTQDYNSREDRNWVRGKFGDDVEDQEPLLPGFGPDGDGDLARDDCGESHPFVCNNCGSEVQFGRTCAMSVCSRCGVAWARDLAIKKTAKTRRVRKEKDYHTPDNEWQKLHHQIISPPLGWWYHLAKAGLSLEEAYDVTKEVVKFILDEFRAQGLVIRHSFRGEREDGSVADESDDRGAWKERLNSDRAWNGDVRDQLAWMPHFHCVVVSDFIKGDQDNLTDRVEEMTGWVFRRISREDGKSVPNDAAMASIVSYSLSHADIMVRENANRSAVWEVGAFEGDAIKSSSRFTATPSDLEWADNVVRRVAVETLGLKSGTTDCGADLPAVDDPDALAKNVLEELYPDDPDGRSEVSTDAVLHHISEGNIDVEVSTLQGGGGTVRASAGAGTTQLPNNATGLSGSAGDLPWSASGVASAVSADGGEEPVEPIEGSDHEDHGDDCSCSSDSSSDDDEDDTCDGTLIPLGTARKRGLLEDDDWLASAAHSDEALEADAEWPDDLMPWRSSSPGSAVGG